MTGYGIDTFHVEETTITVEIRSVNSRYLDFIPKLPRSLQDLELDIKQIIQQHFFRGRLEVSVMVSGNHLTNKTLHVNHHLMDQYIKEIQKIQSKYDVKDSIPLEVLSANEDIFTIEETSIPSESIKPKLLKSVEKAIQQVLTNRKSEGAFLITDILNRIKTLENMVKLIEDCQDNVYHHYRNRIQDRIEKHLGDAVQVDQAQLLQEIALLAEKGDITEELTRLRSHLHHFNQIVREERPIGRKLDFIAQEMHREVNTVGSKSVDASISESIVTMKSEIEKIKEQLQNIE